MRPRGGARASSSPASRARTWWGASSRWTKTSKTLRWWGSGSSLIDRYATSLLVAEAVAADADGSLTHVVMVSGLSWPDAVVAAPVAGALGGPVLMTPPGELRDDAAAFLARTGVTDVVVVGSTGGADAVSAAVVTALEGMGIAVERVGRVDRSRSRTVACTLASSVPQSPPWSA